MRQHGWYERATVTVAVAAGLGTTLLTAPLQAAPETRTIVAFEWSGLENLLPSEKDAGVNRAFGMIPARLHELRMQIPDAREMPEEMLDLGLHLISRPMRFAVTSAPAPGFDGLGATFSVHMGNKDSAAQLDEHMMMFGAMAGMPEPDRSRKYEHMHAVPMPGAGVLNFGPRQANDGWRYEFQYGAVDDPDHTFKALPEMEGGGRIVSRGSFDLSAVTPFANMFLPMVEPMMPPGTMDEIRNQGLLGDEAMAFEYVEGYVGDTAVSRMTSRRLGRYAEAMGVSTTPLTARDLSMVPADAYAAQITKVDMSAYSHQLDGMIVMASEGQADMQMIDEMMQEQLGVSATDLIDGFGETMIAYLSDQTGGNTLLSGVVIMELSDAGPMRTFMERGSDMVNQLIAHEMEREEVPGRVKFQRRTVDGTEYMQLRFPGLPIPFEPTVAMMDNWMVMGLTPQACYGAVQQAKSRSGGLADNAAFKEYLWNVPQRPTGVTFVDTSRTMADGYGTVCLLCSTLANFVRSEDGNRDPGMVVPMLSELKRAAQPMISVTYFEGEDLITETHTDPSLLVNLAGILGVGDVMPMIAGGFIGGGVAAQVAQEVDASDWEEDWDDWDDDEWEDEDMHEAEDDDSY